MSLYDFLKFLHVLSVVFMAAPLYNLIAVNERARFGKAPLQVDQYFESIIRGNAARCYVFQTTVLITGILLTALSNSLAALLTNSVLLVKLLLLLTLMGLLSVIHFGLQPRIDRLLAQVKEDAIPPPIAAEITPLRLRRKRLASVCLFLVIIAVLLGLQVSSAFSPMTTAILVGLAAVFAWRVYRTPIPYGWL